MSFRPKMATYFILLILCFISNNVISSVFLTDFPNSKPKQILTDQKDRFYIDYSSSIRVYYKKHEYTVFINDPKENYASYLYDNDVSPDGKIFSITTSSYKPKKSKITYYRLNIVECIERKCSYQLLGKWTSAKSSSSYHPGKLVISKNGNIFFPVTYNYKSGKKWLSKTTYYLNKKKVTSDEYMTKNKINFPGPKSGVVVSSNKQKDGQHISFVINGKSLEYSEDRSSRYTRSNIVDKYEIPHVFFHNPVDRAFYHHFYSPRKNEIVEVIIDNAESGWENTAFAYEDEIWSIHYFYRDSFNKGLVVTRHDIESGEIKDSFVIDASEIRNSGWELMGTKSSENRILFTYISDENNNTREFVMLDSVKDLKDILGKNFSDYGDPRGYGYLNHIPENTRSEHIATLNSSHSKALRPGYINIGTGVQYVTWSVDSAVPDEDSNVTTPYKPEYELADSILSTVSIEGKYGGTNFGLEYATKVVDKAVENTGSDTAKNINKISGKIGWERFFMNYDFAFQYEKTVSDVYFIDKSAQVAPRSFTLDFSEMKFSLLTMKRGHFGYIYQKYNFYQPVYIYKVPKDSTSYSFIGQAIGDINVSNHFLHAGFSTIDYITKYETGISKWFLDAELRAGASLADFQDDVAITGNKKPKNELALAYAAQIELGYVWYKRWKSLNQLGGVIKLSYRLDYSGIGDSDKPDDKEDPVDSDQYSFGFERSELRHGPLFFVSLNF